MKTTGRLRSADSAMDMVTQRKTEPGEFDACFSEASAGPGRWGSSYENNSWTNVPFVAILTGRPPAWNSPSGSIPRMR